MGKTFVVPIILENNQGVVVFTDLAPINYSLYKNDVFFPLWQIQNMHFVAFKTASCIELNIIISYFVD